MKKIIIVLLVVCLALVPVFVIAQPRYEAGFALSAGVNGVETATDSDYIYVYENDVLDIGFNVISNEDFFAGPLSVEIAFTDDYLSYSTFEWNKKSRFYSAGKSYSNLALKDEGQSFLKLDVIPTSVDCKQAPNALNETLVTMQFVAKGKRDDVAGIYFDESTIRNKDNPFGSSYFACYTENGSLTGKRYDYGNGIKLDFSQASLAFKITDAGDINGDKTITAVDSLMIMQYTTGIATLNSNQVKRADVNYNGKVNSSDGLAALQLSAGMNTINDIINN